MAPQPSRGTIVVVEDPFVSGFLRSILGRKGYDVMSLEATECAALLRSGKRSVGLLITNLPTKFTEFAQRVPLLYLAALPEPAAAAPFRASRLLPKPFHPEQFMSCVEELFRPM
jgi:hypothetical protein